VKRDEEVLAELRRAAAGVWIMSESDYPFEVFRWDGSTEVGPQFLREAAGLAPDAPVRELSPDEFFGGGASPRVWRAAPESGAPEPAPGLLAALRANLRGLRVYKLGEISLPVFVVGRSPEGNWLGVSTRVVET
jgi:hypothetical protein